MAARAIEALIASKLAQQQLMQHTAAVLQAVQPGKPLEVQAAAWQLLAAWVSTHAGRTAVLQQDWLHILDVMAQQGSWVSGGSGAVAAAESSAALRVASNHSSTDSSAAETAARIVSTLAQYEFDAIE
jgi:hypothetical protein